MTDIEIANRANMLKVTQVAKQLGIDEDDIELYGKYKAKINFNNIKQNRHGKLILVTAITPTKSGEGKTTVTVGLGDALHKLNKNVCIALREPSLGPVFGMKGGAAGGGYSQVVPMEDINLHFTGDLHAITAANNLLAAMIDNHIYQGNKLRIDTNNIFWTRCMDMNDRALRNIVVGLSDGPTRKDSFKISVASEIMAIFCLAQNLDDLRYRLDNIVVALDIDGKPIKAADLKATGAMLTLLKDAIKPNLVQTLENTPAIIHGGPFANIAHGCNSVIATKTALKLADYVVTEAGFGADLGAEKFLDIKCRKACLKPNCVVLVVTTKAFSEENLTTHIQNLKKYNVPVVVAINKFTNDTEDDFRPIIDTCNENGVSVSISSAWSDGGDGAIELARYVLEKCEYEYDFNFIQKDTDSVTQKIEAVAKEIYRANNVEFSSKALKSIKKIEKWSSEYKILPVCIAKTQYSLSDNPDLGTTPTNFTLHVKDAYLSAGAGFIVALTGDIMTMPGLPKVPAAEQIDIVENNIVGLF